MGWAFVDLYRECQVRGGDLKEVAQYPMKSMITWSQAISWKVMHPCRLSSIPSI